MITYPSDYDDNLQFDIESDLEEIEFLLYQGKDFSLKDSSIQTDRANFDDYFVDPLPEMFTEEHAPYYSSPLKFDVYLPREKKQRDFSRVDDMPSPDNEDKDYPDCEVSQFVIHKSFTSLASFWESSIQILSTNVFFWLTSQMALDYVATLQNIEDDV
nr:hypothetical protein [Tanacetum cinerariifolium]